MQDITSDTAKNYGNESIAEAQALTTHYLSVHPDFLSWERSKMRLGATSGLVTTLVSVIGWVFAFQTFPTTLFSLGPGFGYLIVLTLMAEFVIPFRLITARGAAHFGSQWHAEGKPPTPTPERVTTRLPSKTANDQSIIEFTNQVADQFHFAATPIFHLAWQSTIPEQKSVQVVPAYGAFFDGTTMYLAEEMKGELSTEEWKPLIASTVIGNWKLRNRWRRRIPVLALVTLTYIALWFVIPPLFPTTVACGSKGCGLNNTGWIIMIIAGPTLLIATILSDIATLSRFQWVADKQVAGTYGKAQLIHSLQRASEIAPANQWLISRRIARLKPSS